MADSTWERRDFPLLEAAVRLDGARDELTVERLALEGSMDDVDDAALGVAALVDAGYLIADVDIRTGGRGRYIIIDRPTEKARRATGQWPSADVYQGLVELLEERIESTDDPEVESKLRGLLESVRNVGTGVATAVLTKFLEQRIGM